MKKIITTLVIAFAFFATPSLAAPAPNESIHVLSIKRYVFQFKVDKELIGATVEIFDECDTLIRTETVSHVRNIVDFFELSAGTYVIKIKKGSEEYVFEYLNIE